VVPLHSLPPGFAATRDGLHRVAEELVAPARKPQNEIALVQSPGGFGTPPFEFEGARMRVRVDGTELVLEAEGEDRRAELDSIAAGAELLGPDLLPGGLPGDETPLGLDDDAASSLAAWFEFAAELLGSLRKRLPAAADASPAILWPEHFDLAIEAGEEASEAGATYGASPGDENHAEPYLYVGPWAKQEGELWNATGFAGAELGYEELLETGDSHSLALTFFEKRHEALAH